MPPLNLILHPAGNQCNLNCVYCFQKCQPTGNFMSDQTAQTIASQVAQWHGGATVTFGGGEPTLCGLDFFERFVGYVNQAKPQKKISYVLETNGTQINEAFADFLANQSFSVLLSLDGYKETHDLNRFNEKGAGSFSQTMKAASMFEKRHIPFSVLCVVNRLTAKHVEKIYTFFKKCKFKALVFLPCLDETPQKRGKSFYSITPLLYGQFLKTLFDFWYNDFVKGEAVSIKHFDNFISTMFGYPAEHCHLNGICSAQIVIDEKGLAYPCVHYMKEPFLLGNTNQTTFQELLETKIAKEFLAESFHIHDDCNRCKYFKMCRGGCKFDREPRTQNALGLNVWCEAYKSFFAYAWVRLQKIAALLNTNRFV